MKLELLYRIYRTAKTSMELAYLFGFFAGKKLQKR